MNSAEQLIYAAASLLKADGDLEEALVVLGEAINVAGTSRRMLELIRAKTFRGELLVQMGRPAEAIADFGDVAALAELFDGDAAQIDEEAVACRDWLLKLEE
ncbi:MAG: hypothetical protein ABI718_02870 [Acidobacteriota bacterium]